MKRYLVFMAAILFIRCTKSQQDTTFTYNCVSTYQKDPFTVITKDTTLSNVTDASANAYVRNTSVNGWYTTCSRY